MLNRACIMLALSALLLPARGFCDDKIQWSRDSGENKSARVQVDGMKTFYEPANVKHDGDVKSFRMYASYDPTVKEEGDEYAINCATQEIAIKQGKAAWTAPFRVLPGEQLFPIAKKLCDWGPGFWKRLTE